MILRFKKKVLLSGSSTSIHSLLAFTKSINVCQLSCLRSELRCVVQSLLERRDHQEHDDEQAQSPTHQVVAGGATDKVSPEVRYRYRDTADQTQVETGLLANTCVEYRQK